MIVRPTRGFARSVGSHNVDLQILCDWIEGSVLFIDGEVSQTDVVDSLVEDELYDEQSFAQVLVSDAWGELKRRINVTGSAYGVTVEKRWVRSRGEWNDFPAHVFCLLLSLAANYEWWDRRFKKRYGEQGELFEMLTGEALNAIGSGWEAYRTGWGKSNVPPSKQLLRDVAERVRSDDFDVSKWSSRKSKDMEVDVLWYRPFPDGRQGAPYFLIQCASGKHWKRKINTPNLAVWADVLRPATAPMRGFAVPFCFSTSDFRDRCVETTGVFLDRCRILGAEEWSSEWLSDDTQKKLVDWSRERVEELISRTGI